MNGEGDYDVFGDDVQDGGDNENDNIGVESGDDDVQDGGSTKRFQRHTAEQTQQLENFFKENPNPSENQKLELGQRLNLETNQIRFWFENRRTQEKTQMKRQENLALRETNNRLQRDHEQLSQAMLHSACNICGNSTDLAQMDLEARQLIDENTRLAQEIPQLMNYHQFLSTQVQQQVTPSLAHPSSSVMVSNEPLQLGSSGARTPMMFLDLAVAATNEVVMLGGNSCPFWRIDSSSKRESLNYALYKSAFSSGIKPPGYVVEATKETGFVHFTSLALVETLMNTNKWADLFAPIVSMASSQTLLPTGPGGTISGSLQLIQAEFQVISPLVPKRQVKFLRYFKEHREGLWTVVDVTPDMMSKNGASRRLPSGLIIEDSTNDNSKVTWIEQAEYDERNIHQLYQPLINSGIGLGAKRWLTTLKRRCDSISSLSSINLTQLSPGFSTEVATEIVKLAERMTLSYYSGITGSSVYNWEMIQVENQIQNMRLMTRKVNENEVGEHTGIVLSASTSLWLPVSQKILFYFLSNNSFRSQWDTLTHKTFMEDTIKIEKAKPHGNLVSLLKIIEDGMQILQEVWNDASGSLLVYAPLVNNSVEELMKGENSDSVKLLPSGFAILPDAESGPDGEEDKTEGSLLTVGFQILVSTNPTMELTQDSVNMIEKLMVRTIDNIKSGLQLQA